MMKYHKKSRIMEMELYDLEHCGFDYEEYLKELFLHGFDDEDAENPTALIVNFAGGSVIINDTTQKELAEIKSKTKEFKEMVKAVNAKMGEKGYSDAG